MRGQKMKVYNDISELFEDGIFSPYEIIIFWGKRGKGKSSLMGKFMSDFMKPQNAQPRIEDSKWRCEKLRQAEIYLTPPEDHLVFCDTYFEDNGFQGNGRRPYEYSGLHFGLPNTIYKEIQPVVPCASLFLDEIQDLYDSHYGALPPYISKAFELSRQVGVFIAMACQRPMRVVKDIRDLATFVEVVGMEHMYIRDKIIKTIWTVNIIYDNAKFEKYDDTKDPKLIDKTIKIAFTGDIFSCYDPFFFMPLFYKGFEKQYFITYEKVEKTEFSTEGFDRYNSKRTIDIPKEFRGKEDKKSKKEKTENKKDE